MCFIIHNYRIHYKPESTHFFLRQIIEDADLIIEIDKKKPELFAKMQ